MLAAEINLTHVFETVYTFLRLPLFVILISVLNDLSCQALLGEEKGEMITSMTTALKYKRHKTSSTSLFSSRFEQKL
jgi:hypothetical protein